MQDRSPETSPETTVLIVEDEETVRTAIEAGLEVIGGFEVISATGAEEGLQFLKDRHPEILLLDLVMPVTDGMQFLRRMGDDPDAFRPQKVVLMTAMENPVPPDQLGVLGIDLILSKPFRLNELASAVGKNSPF